MLVILGSSWKCPWVSPDPGCKQRHGVFFCGLIIRLAESNLLSRQSWNWSLAPNSTDFILLLYDSMQCVPCHRAGLWLSISHAANDSSFGVLDNTYSSLGLWVRGLGGVYLGTSGSMSLKAAIRMWAYLLSWNQLPGVAPLSVKPPGLLTWTSRGLLLRHGTWVPLYIQ